MNYYQVTSSDGQTDRQKAMHMSPPVQCGQRGLKENHELVRVAFNQYTLQKASDSGRTNFKMAGSNSSLGKNGDWQKCKSYWYDSVSHC